MSEHAPAPSSGAPKWVPCPGSRYAEAHYPDVETQQAREGTAGHWVVSETLTRIRNGFVSEPSEWLGATAPNGVVIDEKMVDGAEVMVRDVLRVCQEHNPSLDRLLIEHRVYMPHIHPDNWGTLDVALPIPGHVTYVWDYKHGHGDVDAVGNWQLADYAAGLPENQLYVLMIVKPFCYSSDGPVSSWHVEGTFLRERLIPRMRDSAHSDYTLAGSHCRYCKALPDCATARQYGLDLIHQRPLLLDRDMSPADRARLWEELRDGLPVLKEMVGQLEDEVKSDLPPGYAVEVTNGRLDWSVPPAQVIALGQLLEADLSKPAVRTPTQAKKLVPKDVYDACIKPLTKRDAGTTKLVRAKDSKASRAFQPKT